MSEFFRIPANPDLYAVGLTSLARLSHQAEDAGDDVLLMQVMDVVVSRGSLAVDVFREEYIRLHRVITAERKAKRKPKCPGTSPGSRTRGKTTT